MVTFLEKRPAGDFPFLDKETIQPSPILETKNLSAWYGKKQVFADLNMSISPNAITAIIGYSGCGKSTLLRLLNRLHEETPSARVSGDVFFEGKNIYTPDTDAVWVRQQIGIVF